MAEPSWPNEVELSAYLPDVSTAKVGLRLAAPVVLLAADLLRRVPRRVGVRNASELVAALLVHAAQESDSLGEMIGDYRETRVHQVLAGDQIEGVHQLDPRPDLEL